MNMPPGFPPPGLPAAPVPPPPKRRKAGVIAAVVGGVVLLSCLLCCGGIGGIVTWGMKMVEDDVEASLRDDPVMTEHIGTVQSFDIVWGESIDEDDDDVFVYEVRGTRGSGKATVKSVTQGDGSERIIWARLKLSTGQEHTLVGSPPERR
jgi:hypothetical protein